MSTKESVIFDAAKHNDLTAIKRFVEDSRKAIAPGWAIKEVSRIAARHGNLDIIKYVLDKYPAMCAAHDTYGNTIFPEAIRHGHLDVVKYLIEHGKADMLQPCKTISGHPNAVHQVAQFGHLQILKYFVEEKSADVNASDEFGRPIVFFAATGKHHAIVKYLLEEKKADLTRIDFRGDNVLYVAVRESDLELIEHLLDEWKVPLDVNWKNKYGTTILHMAAFQDQVDILSYLVEKKRVDVNIADDYGQTPLHSAALGNAQKSCEYLIKRGANMVLKDKNGKSPVDEASDALLFEYLNEELQKRTRRSVPESFLDARTGVVREIVHRNRNNLPWSADRLEQSASSSFVGRTLTLLNFLEVAGILIRRNLKSIGRTFLSPGDIAASRIDPLAIEAIQRVPN